MGPSLSQGHKKHKKSSKRKKRRTDRHRHRDLESVGEDGAGEGTEYVDHGPPGIQDLPSEVRLIIFSYLTPRELCQFVAPVCKAWHREHSDPSLWKVLDLRIVSWKSSAPFRRELVRIVSRCTKLRTLLVNGLEWEVLKEETPDHLLHLFPCASLRTLEIAYPVTASCPEWLEFMCPNVETLTLHTWRYDWQVFLDCVCPLANLKTLKLSGGYADLDDAVVEEILRRCTGLHSLVVPDASRLTDATLDNVILYCGGRIRSLHLHAAGMTAQAISALTLCPDLVSLGLNGCTVETDEDLRALSHLPIADLCLVPPTYTVLETEVTSSAFVQFFSMPERVVLHHLKVLGYYHLDDPVVKSINENCPNLKTMFLCECYFTDREIRPHDIYFAYYLHRTNSRTS